MSLKGVGLFGGTFNPVHMAHLRVAEEVREEFGLSRICFIPSAIPPHKDARGLAPAADRFEMITRAIAAHPQFFASDVEIKRRGRSYTIDTIRHFMKISLEDAPCYLMVGSDAFFEIDTWKTFGSLFDHIPMIVMQRPVPEADHAAGFIERMAEFLSLRVDGDYSFDADRLVFKHPRKHPVFLFKVTPLDISSTRIRDLVLQGRSIRYLVPDTVNAYIQANGLYI